MKSRTQKRDESKVRNEKTASLTPQQRLEKLDQLLGKGVGAKKERSKLQSKIVA